MASVLKQDTLAQGSEAYTPVAFNMEDVQTRAKDVLSEARQQAEQLLQQARQEAEAIRAEAKARGLAEAAAEINQKIELSAQQLSDNRCKTAIAACESSVAQLTQETAKWLAAFRNQTVELAAKIAEKIVRREMQDHDETLRVWMEEAIVAMRDARDIRVLVHPDDFAVAGRFLQQLAKTIPQAASVEVLPDPQVHAGGCIVRSNHGRIDQQLETQLQRLVQQLA